MSEYSVNEIGKVAVLMGGKSGEREISLQSGQAVLKALIKSKVDACAVDVDTNVFSILREKKFDRAFIVLHGCGGEDGSLQGGLETVELPYTGSGVMASSICMNKIMTKRVWRAEGINSPNFMQITTETTYEDVVSTLNLPFVIKPSLEGSSLGIHKVENAQQYKSAVNDAEKFNGSLMAEQWIDGAEYTIAILHDSALPTIRLETPRTFYDFEAKYQSKSTKYLIPCGLESSAEVALQQQALHAFKATGACGWGRVDVMVDADGECWFLEVNTVPGMTDHSLVPMAAASMGINFSQLTMDILATSFVDE